MRALPNIFRNAVDKSITLSMPQSKLSLIWLHGLGDSPEGFYDYFLHPLSPLYQGFRIKLVASPTRYVSIIEGNSTSWYDIKSTDRYQQQEKVYNLEHVQESMGIIDSVVKGEIQHWNQNPISIFPNHRIVIGGFSQGAAMALKYGLECQYPLAGIVSYSGYLLSSAKLQNLGKTNILINHGKRDEVVPFGYASTSYKELKEDLRTKLEYIDRLEHTVTLSQLKNLSSWLNTLSDQMEQFYKSST